MSITVDLEELNTYASAAAMYLIYKSTCNVVNQVNGNKEQA